MTTTREAAAEHFSAGLTAHQAGRLEIAEEGYRVALGLDPLHAPARNNLAILLLHRGEHEAAIALLEEAVALSPGFADAWNSLGAARMVAGDLKGAQDALARAISLGHADALANVARLESRTGRPAEVLAAAATAHAVRPSAEMAELAAKAALALGDKARAEAWTKHWFDCSADNRDAFVARAALLRDRPVALEQAARRHLERIPDNPQAWNALGVALLAQQRWPEALEAFDHVIALVPEDAHARNNRATAFRKLGRIEEALGDAQRACELDPSYPEARNTLGNMLSALERLPEALAAYEEALALRPGFLEAAANAMLALGDLDRAEEGLRRLAEWRAQRGDAPLLAKVEGVLLVRLERFAEAETRLRRALAAFPDDAEIAGQLGISLQQQGLEGEAEELLLGAITRLPKPVSALNALGNLQAALGRNTEAIATLRQAIDLMPDNPGLYRNLADLHRFRRDEPLFARLIALEAQRETLPDRQQVELLYALAKAWDDIGEEDRAWEYFIAAGRLHRRLLGPESGLGERMLETLRQTITREVFENLRGRGFPSRLPVFILGMPRSGTTLMEQILAAHPLVFAAGELKLLAETLGYGLMLDNLHLDGMPREDSDPKRAQPIETGLFDWGRRYTERLRMLSPSAWRITDKMPGNFAKLGLIALALPGAKIIHMRRHPLDTCLSCFRTRFARGQEWSYDLTELGHYYSAYWRLMEHWRNVCPDAFIEVDYEALVTDIESETRRVLAYLELPWHDGCLRFHEVDRPVHTASLAQVRRPLYTSSVARWQGMLPKLAPLIAALDPALRAAHGIPDPKDISR